MLFGADVKEVFLAGQEEVDILGKVGSWDDGCKLSSGCEVRSLELRVRLFVACMYIYPLRNGYDWDF